jgi:hypothetical protein
MELHRRHRANTNMKRLKQLISVLLPFTALLAAKAQPVVTPVPAASEPPPDFRPSPAEQNEAVPPAEAVAGTRQETSPYQWGPVTLYPHLLYRFLYGDGIEVSQGAHASTYENDLSPGLLVDLGKYWTLDYTPTWTLYSNHQFTDTVDHAVNLAGGTTYDDWALQFSQGYDYVNQPLIETGGQTTQQTFSTAFTASYHFGSRMQLDSTPSQTLRFTKGFSDSREWSDDEKLHYLFSKHLDAFVALGLGYVEESNSPDMNYLQPSMGVTCHPTDKLSVEADAGFEDRRFLGSNASDLVTPVFGASVLYQPATTTKLTLAGARQVDVSPFQNQITKTTNLSADLNQRLLQHFYLDASLGQEWVNYVSSVGNAGPERDDEIYTFEVKLSTVFLSRGTVSVFYEDSHDSSNTPGFGFTSHQIGFETGYRY